MPKYNFSLVDTSLNYFFLISHTYLFQKIEKALKQVVETTHDCSKMRKIESIVLTRMLVSSGAG